MTAPYVVYTAVFGAYDELKELPKLSSEIDAICFTDNKGIFAKGRQKMYENGWELRLVTEPVSGILLNRQFKILSHKYLAEYRASLYIDASVILLKNPLPLFHKYLDSPLGFAAPVHPFRNCIYREAFECLILGKVKLRSLLKKICAYRSEGMPGRFGLTANGILLREHHNTELNALMDCWWNEFDLSIPRDQLSLPYCLWRSELVPQKMTEAPWYSEDWFYLERHQHEKGIWTFRPYIWCRKLFGCLTVGWVFALILLYSGNSSKDF